MPQVDPMKLPPLEVVYKHSQYVVEALTSQGLSEDEAAHIIHLVSEAPKQMERIAELEAKLVDVETDQDDLVMGAINAALDETTDKDRYMIMDDGRWEQVDAEKIFKDFMGHKFQPLPSAPLSGE